MEARDEVASTARRSLDDYLEGAAGIHYLCVNMAIKSSLT